MAPYVTYFLDWHVRALRASHKLQWQLDCKWMGDLWDLYGFVLFTGAILYIYIYRERERV